MTPKLSSSWVCFRSLFRTTCAFASFRSSMTTRMPSLFDSSLISVMPSTLLSFTSSAIFSRSFALFTRYGNWVTTMRLFPFGMVSMSVTARTFILPRPVLYASFMPAFPMIVAPVGKSGPFTIEMTSSRRVSLSSILSSMILSTADMTSRRL